MNKNEGSNLGQSHDSAQRLIITNLEEEYEIRKAEYIQKSKEARKEKRNNRKWIIWVIGLPVLIIAVIFILGFGIAAALSSSPDIGNKNQYSLDQISITVSKKETDSDGGVWIDGKTVLLFFEVKNETDGLLSEVVGDMDVYLGESNYLMTWNIRLSDEVKAGDCRTSIVQCSARESEAMNKFFKADLKELKLTLRISYAYFGNNASDIKREEGDSTVRIIKPYKEEEVRALNEQNKRKYQLALNLM